MEMAMIFGPVTALEIHIAPNNDTPIKTWTGITFFLLPHRVGHNFNTYNGADTAGIRLLLKLYTHSVVWYRSFQSEGSRTLQNWSDTLCPENIQGQLKWRRHKAFQIAAAVFLSNVSPVEVCEWWWWGWFETPGINNLLWVQLSTAAPTGPAHTQPRCCSAHNLHTTHFACTQFAHYSHYSRYNLHTICTLQNMVLTHFSHTTYTQSRY